MGIHFESFFIHIFINYYESKYYEYMLHHGVAFYLIFFSYITNMLEGGSVVLIMHDSSDVILTFIRAIADFKVNIIY